MRRRRPRVHPPRSLLDTESLGALRRVWRGAWAPELWPASREDLARAWRALAGLQAGVQTGVEWRPLRCARRCASGERAGGAGETGHLRGEHGVPAS